MNILIEYIVYEATEYNLTEGYIRNLQMMEIREAVSDATDSETLGKIQSQVFLVSECSYTCYHQGSDYVTMISGLTVFHTFQIKRKLKTWSDSFQEAFDKRDFNRAVEAAQRMRYYERAVEETVKKL